MEPQISPPTTGGGRRVTVVLVKGSHVVAGLVDQTLSVPPPVLMRTSLRGGRRGAAWSMGSAPTTPVGGLRSVVPQVVDTEGPGGVSVAGQWPSRSDTGGLRSVDTWAENTEGVLEAIQQPSHSERVL